MNLAAASDLATNAAELLVPVAPSGSVQATSAFDFSSLLEMLLPSFEWSGAESPDSEPRAGNATAEPERGDSSDGQLTSLASLFTYVPVLRPVPPPQPMEVCAVAEQADNIAVPAAISGRAAQPLIEDSGAESAPGAELEAVGSIPERTPTVAFNAKLVARDEEAPGNPASPTISAVRANRMSGLGETGPSNDFQTAQVSNAPSQNTWAAPVIEPKDAVPLAEGSAAEAKRVIEPGSATAQVTKEGASDPGPVSASGRRSDDGAAQDKRESPEQPRTEEPVKVNSHPDSDSARRRSEPQHIEAAPPTARAAEVQAHPVGHAPAAEGLRFAPRTGTPQQTPAPAQAEPAPDLPHPQSPIQNLRLRVQTDDSSVVDLNIHQRGSAVQVSVRSTDQSLNASLREHLPTLVDNVQRAGYRMETTTAATNEGGPNLRVHTAEIAQQGSTWQQDAEHKRQQQMYDEPPRQRRSRTAENEQFDWQKILEVL